MADLSGQRLGPFEIRSLVGTGGFATVYRAHDPRLGTEVALKILAENHSLDPTIRERFLGEANALRRVDSPSVVRIYDIRETPDARPYLVLEFADRGDLVGRRRELTANGWGPAAPDVRAVIESLAEALDAVHAEDLVHRDITPSNVLIRSGRRTTSRPGVVVVQPDERLMLSDMGLVKDLSAGSSLTVGGGTAGFWAPEQQQAMASVDHRTDIYSASALLVWFLSGTTVTSSPTWDDSLRSHGWPPQLVTELLRGLALDPSDRHQTIREWEAALMGSLADPAPGAVFQPPAPAPPAPSPHVATPQLATSVSETGVASSGPMALAEPEQASSRNSILLALAALAGAAVIGLLAFVVLGGGADESVEAADDADVVAATSAPATQDEPNETPQSPEDTEPPADTEPQGDSPQESEQPTGPVEERTIDTWAMAVHGGGSQLVVEQVSVFADRTTVEFVAINGRDFDTRFRADARTTRLVSENGAAYALLNDDSLQLAGGQSETFTLDFEPLPAEVARIAVEFNVTEDDEQSIEEGFPGFVVDVDLTEHVAAPALPAPVLIDDIGVHPNSTTVRISGIGFSDTNISVGFVGTNGSPRLVSFSAGNHASFLEDDLGNIYWLKFDDTRYLRVDDGFEAAGVLVFAGRLHPDASTLKLILNHEESATAQSESEPKFELGPWPLDGTFDGVGTIGSIAVQDARTHPNSVELTLVSIEFDETFGRATIDAVNNRRVQVYLNGCCDNSYVLDDLGNRYLFQGLGFNDDLRIPGEEQLGGAVVFLGAIDPAAGTIQVVINDRSEGGLEDPGTAHPEFVFGPFTLVRSAADLPLGFDPASFGTVSAWAVDRPE